MTDQTPEAQKAARTAFSALLRSGKYHHRLGPQIADLDNCRLCAIMAWAHAQGLIPTSHPARIYACFEKKTGMRADTVWQMNDFPDIGQEEGDPAIFEEIARYADTFTPRTPA